MARTETNMAYRTADFERINQLGFVVGIRVVLSNNHTSLGSDGKAHDLYDICDELQGDYPKDFKFVGWHPHCRCHVETILKTDEELDADNARILNGEEPQSGSVNEVKQVPPNFKDWLENNIGRAKGRASLPYFIADNPKQVAKALGITDDSKQIANLVGIATEPNGTPNTTNSEYEAAMKYNKKHANFTPEIEKNNKELEEALPVMQGKIMNFTEADGSHSNPHFSDADAKEQGYKHNCQTCTMSYELRRRGFDVEAKPNKDNEFYNIWCVKNNLTWLDRFLNADGSRAKRKIFLQSKDSIKLRTELIENNTKDTGRYELFLDWKTKKGEKRSSHVMIVERQANGNLLWFDPQTSLHGSLKAFSHYLKRAKTFGLSVLRIDNKIINPKFAERFKKASK